LLKGIMFICLAVMFIGVPVAGVAAAETVKVG